MFKTYVQIVLTLNEYGKRYKAWRNYGKVKDNKVEYLKTFDKRVYMLGLKALEYERIMKGNLKRLGEVKK